MTGRGDRFGADGASRNAEISARIVSVRRRRVWKGALIAGLAALICAVAGCLLMVRSHGIKSDVADMRDEVGETLTMMSLGDASDAVSRHLPRLSTTIAKWKRRFSEKSERFRGLDEEIDRVQAMYRLEGLSNQWREELEGVSPMQRSDQWRKITKGRVSEEQKKWPNRTHRKGALEWMADVACEFWYGVKHALVWPVGIYERTVEIAKADNLGNLDVTDRLHYILFPYRLSAFTMLRLVGMTLTTGLTGYFLCWAGLKTRFGWCSYVGLACFVYLLMAALFIIWLEVTA